MKTVSPIPYALLGHPVGHSLSPAMHNAAFQHLGLPGRYILLDVAPADLETTLDELHGQSFGGLNITIPHKEAACRFLNRYHSLSDTARRLGSVNTVVFHRDGRMEGHNTDAPGFLDAFREAFRATPRGKHVMLLGCGGAGRALALTCVEQGAASLRLVDVNPDVRCRLRRAIRRRAPDLPVAGMAPARAARVAAQCNVIIQATPVGMKPGDPSLLPPEAFRKGQLVVDLIYNPARTPLLAIAKAAGARVANGLGMLLHQGVRAFRLWTGQKPPVNVMRAALEQGLQDRPPR
ncbi:MAG: shikimate dehydrogenase [Lentisphaerae bacterium]|jgi:shikimate dehydrogenase|nr:shikimate dehydrogenase [Lentisphaerota bacterium]